MSHSTVAIDEIEIQASEADVERQAYLDETRIDSLQFGAGRVRTNEE